MNNCKEIKDLMLTNYADGQMDGVGRQQVEAHLLSCASCQDFAREVKSVLGLLEKAQQQPVPQEIWMNIKEAIAHENSIQPSLWTRFREWLNGLTLPRLVPAVVSLAMVFLISSTVFFNLQVKQADDQENTAYVAYVLTSADRGLPEEGEDFGTPIERYFL